MRILSVLLAAAALAGGVLGQPLPAKKVPATVRDAFRAKFPDAGEAEWKLQSDRTYEAEFTLRGVEVAAKFNGQGQWLETESAIEQSALPAKVRAALAQEYPGFKIIETQKVQRAGDQPLLFEVHVENAEQILKLQLKEDGTVASRSSKRKQGG